MRNGNFKKAPTGHTLNQGSYRTYEEWKHVSVLQAAIGSVRSYRTYEEWKRDK